MTELTAQERAALALWLLMQGPLTTREISARCGLTMGATWAMLQKLARVVPIYQVGREWTINNRPDI